ncbi:MAG: hypothetical protein V2J12_07665 [Gammaproteobacteria bacterium]|jgi:hypothetical protein|nr:hypothetical protein [Gammaproteobacteria bacterium]
MINLADAEHARDTARQQVRASRVRVEAAGGRCRHAAVATLTSPAGLGVVFALGWLFGAPGAGHAARKPGFTRRLRQTLAATLTSQRLWFFLSKQASGDSRAQST